LSALFTVPEIEVGTLPSDRRGSFFGALTVIALGGILAFAVQHSPRVLDLHATGLILIIAGIATLVLRFSIGNSPLLSKQAADVAAVVEPLGEPMLDAFGNPVPPGVAAAQVMAPPIPVVAPVAPTLPTSQTITQAPLVTPPSTVVDPDPTRLMRPIGREPDVVSADQVVRHVGDYETAESLAPVSPLTGKPVRVGRRGRFGRSRPS
jgi:hypothetical protein